MFPYSTVFLFCFGDVHAVFQIEVWNLVFAKPENGKYIVYCVQCARNADLNNFRVLQQYTFEELSSTYDNFRLYPVSLLKCSQFFSYYFIMITIIIAIVTIIMVPLLFLLSILSLLVGPKSCFWWIKCFFQQNRGSTIC